MKNYSCLSFLLTSELLNFCSEDLAGVKILHGLDKVVEGGAVVLTLKDQNILANGDINDGTLYLQYIVVYVFDLFIN